MRLGNGALVASTAPHIAVLSLGLKLRTIIADPRLKAIRIRSRYAWLIPISRRVPFSAVKSVRYTYADWNPLQHLPLAVYQELDMFTVSLDLTTGQELILCRFFGPGDWVNEHFMPDWVYWDEQIAARLAHGSQEHESMLYASALSTMIGVPLES